VSASGPLKADRVTFRGNRAQYGGGIAASASAEVSDALFVGNIATQLGTAFYASQNADAEILHATFANQQFPYSGQSLTDTTGATLYADSSQGASANVVVANSILWDDSVPASGVLVSFRSSCLKVAARAGEDVADNLSECGPSDGEAPFADIANGDFHLADGARAIDAGDTALTTDRGLSLDLDRRARVIGDADLGPYEHP
jgi:predicted outer membrane repeat protein